MKNGSQEKKQELLNDLENICFRLEGSFDRVAEDYETYIDIDRIEEAGKQMKGDVDDLRSLVGEVSEFADDFKRLNLEWIEKYFSGGV